MFNCCYETDADSADNKRTRSRRPASPVILICLQLFHINQRQSTRYESRLAFKNQLLTLQTLLRTRPRFQELF